VSVIHRAHKLASLIPLGALLASCVVPTPVPHPMVTPAPEPLTLTDSRGQEVQVAREVRRIVSLAPVQ
jgi:ABC-type Fe3+-hydroxamate transport system substrate-binding protein